MTEFPDPTPRPATVVVIDATAPDGEAALDLVPDHTAAVVMLPLDGPSAAALAEFADAEDVSLAEAGDIYLAQVTLRLERRGIQVEVFSSAGDACADILDLADRPSVAQVALPPRAATNRTISLSELVRRSPVPVVLAPGSTAA